jgi:ribonuclease P protein component
VSRKVGGATQRSRVKRLLREAFAVEAKRLPEGTDAVVVARQEAWGLAERKGLPGVQSALSELISRAIGPDEHEPEEPEAPVVAVAATPGDDGDSHRDAATSGTAA